MVMVAAAKNKIENCQPYGISQHERLAPDPFNKAKRNKGEGKIDRTGPRNVLEHDGDVIPGRTEDIFRVIEDHIDAAPLLEYG